MLGNDKQLFYLYDLPKIVTSSVRMTQVIKERTGYELPDPVQFRDCKPNPNTGVASPFQLGIIKVDVPDYKRFCEAMKYFEIIDNDGVKWQCRGLPYDKDLVGAQKLNTNIKQNIFVKKIP
jgi:hypothetical protein